jgi:acetylglutamate kinase
MRETGFLESDALLTVQEGDIEEAEKILEELYPGELKKLEAACDALSSLCYKAYRRKVGSG